MAAAAISPDGRLLASGDRDGVVRFTDLRTWKPSGPSLRLDRPVLEQAMQFAPDGRTVAVGSGRGNRTDVHFVDVATRRARRVRSWRGPVTTIDAQTLLLAYAPDGRDLAVALAMFDDTGVLSMKQRLALLDARSGRTVWERAYPSMRKDQHEVHVGFTPDGALITSASQGETLVWDARRGRILRRYPIGGRMAISPDGKRVAIALNGPELRRPAHRHRGAEPPDGQVTGPWPTTCRTPSPTAWRSTATARGSSAAPTRARTSGT